jgi:hypothetical protein
MRWVQRSIGALLVAGSLSLGFVGPATAQVQIPDGLVNVTVGDVTILEDVNISVAARVVALICGLQVGPLNVLGRSVDLGAPSEPSCTVDDGVPITIIQN